jgi:hypothetical protein
MLGATKGGDSMAQVQVPAQLVSVESVTFNDGTIRPRASVKLDTGAVVDVWGTNDSGEALSGFKDAAMGTSVVLTFEVRPHGGQGSGQLSDRLPAGAGALGASVPGAFGFPGLTSAPAGCRKRAVFSSRGGRVPECTWEWGGVVEATPAPCVLEVKSPDLLDTVTLGLGLLVFFVVLATVWSWRGRRG